MMNLVKSPWGVARFACLICALVIAARVQAGVPIETWTQENGTRVFLVATPQLPILDVAMDFRAGMAYNPPGRPGVAGLTHSLLYLGSDDMDENAIAERMVDLGANLGGSVGHDRATVSLRTLKEKRHEALAMMKKVVSRPAFDQKVFEREQTNSVAALRDALTRPDTLASRAFAQALYSGHPYGQLNTPETLASLKKDELQAFYQRYYRADRLVVSLVGDITRSEAEAIVRTLTESLPSSGETIAATPPVGASPSQEVKIEHPASQAHILIGMPVLRRNDPDFFPLVVGNYVLGGGGFVSRLMQQVREKRGMAYSVYSYFSPLQEAGPFQIGLQTKKAQAVEAKRVVGEVFENFIKEGPTAAELQAAKDNIIGGFPLRLDSNAKLLDNLAVMAFYDLPLDWLERYPREVEKVTAEQVREAFIRRVPTRALHTVLVGAE